MDITTVVVIYYYIFALRLPTYLSRSTTLPGAWSSIVKHPHYVSYICVEWGEYFDHGSVVHSLVELTIDGTAL